jgi:hypothetical protein
VPVIHGRLAVVNIVMCCLLAIAARNHPTAHGYCNVQQIPHTGP